LPQYQKYAASIALCKQPCVIPALLYFSVLLNKNTYEVDGKKDWIYEKIFKVDKVIKQHFLFFDVTDCFSGKKFMPHLTVNGILILYAGQCMTDVIRRYYNIDTITNYPTPNGTLLRLNDNPWLPILSI
jgi:hypothetical protein